MGRGLKELLSKLLLRLCCNAQSDWLASRAQGSDEMALPFSGKPHPSPSANARSPASHSPAIAFCRIRASLPRQANHTLPQDEKRRGAQNDVLNNEVNADGNSMES